MAGALHHVLAVSIFGPHTLLASAGPVVVFLFIFAETGLLVGFFLPGDSLLFTAGLLCATRAPSAAHLSLAFVAAAMAVLLAAEARSFFGRRAAERAEQALQRYGPGQVVILARFIPVVRTVMNPLAEAMEMPARTFTVWQVTGGLIWSAGVTIAGYLLGSREASIDHDLPQIVTAIVMLSVLPVAIELSHPRSRAGGR